jgi:hypothetical protein
MTVEIDLVVQRLCDPFEALLQETNAIVTVNIKVPPMKSGIISIRITGFLEPLLFNQWVSETYPLHLSSAHHVNLLYFPSVIISPDFVDCIFSVKFV